MLRPKMICVMLLPTLVLAGVAAASASAKVLTMTANGAPLTLGTQETSPFFLESTSPITITVSGSGLSTTCTPKTDWLMRGYLLSNGKSTDKVRMTEEGGLNEVRHCSGGANVAGPQFAGKLELKANGGALMVPTSTRPKLYVLVNACIYSAPSLPVSATLNEPLAISFDVTLKSEEPGCTEATLETGPFQATFESEVVEDLVS